MANLVERKKRRFESLQKKILLKLFLFRNSLFFRYSFHRRGGKRYFVLPPSYEKPISSIKYIFTFISLVSAYFIFSSVHYAFLFGIVTWFLSSMLERFLFSYDTIFVHPFPDFQWEPERWIAMAFGYGLIDDNEDLKIPYVFMAFDDREYVKNVHDLLLAWTGNNHKDERKLVSASVIFLDDGEYVFYIYPSMSRDEESGVYKNLHKEFHDSHPNKVHKRSTVSFFIGKCFPISEKSFLPRFAEMYSDGVPIMLKTAFMEDKASQPVAVDGCEDFIIFDFKIRKQGDLTRKDAEYDLIRFNDLIED